MQVWKPRRNEAGHLFLLSDVTIVWAVLRRRDRVPAKCLIEMGQEGALGVEASAVGQLKSRNALEPACVRVFTAM
jgi:hypothetical protein